VDRRHPRWADGPLDPTTYKPAKGRPISEARAEQDRAAGGAHRRIVRLAGGGQSRASIDLKHLGGRRIYAYLRYTEDGRSVARYVGEAPGETREERLAAAWAIARRDGLLGTGGSHPRVSR
jgi:DNA mismatch endonuclease (patch repair protein)